MKRLLRWDVKIYCVDHWRVYPKEMPAGCYYLQSKAGTVGIERNNSRQRHWFARFRRKSIVVSKSKEMVDLTMALFARFHVNGSMDDLVSLQGLVGILVCLKGISEVK
jgi:IS1 family transposase